MPLRLERATLQQKDLIQNLLNMYLHEMSAFEDFEVADNGDFEYPNFSCFFVEPDRHPFIVRVKGKVVLVKDIDSLRGGSIHTIPEFFIMHTYRRLGIGEEIARMVFDLFPGKWQVAVHEHNKVGRQFWKTVIWRYTGGVMHEFRTPGMDGPVYEFGSPGANVPDPPPATE